MYIKWIIILDNFCIITSQKKTIFNNVLNNAIFFFATFLSRNSKKVYNFYAFLSLKFVADHIKLTVHTTETVKSSSDKHRAKAQPSVRWFMISHWGCSSIANHVNLRFSIVKRACSSNERLRFAREFGRVCNVVVALSSSSTRNRIGPAACGSFIRAGILRVPTRPWSCYRRCALK